MVAESIICILESIAFAHFGGADALWSPGVLSVEVKFALVSSRDIIDDQKCS